jgi:hypothetical protein
MHPRVIATSTVLFDLMDRPTANMDRYSTPVSKSTWATGGPTVDRGFSVIPLRLDPAICMRTRNGGPGQPISERKTVSDFRT